MGWGVVCVCARVFACVRACGACIAASSHLPVTVPVRGCAVAAGFGRAVFPPDAEGRPGEVHQALPAAFPRDP